MLRTRIDGTVSCEEYRAIDFETGAVVVEARNLPFIRNYLRAAPMRVTVQQLRAHPMAGLCHWEALDEESEAIETRRLGVSR